MLNNYKFLSKLEYLTEQMQPHGQHSSTHQTDLTQKTASIYTTLTDLKHSYPTSHQQLQTPQLSEAEKLIVDFEFANTCAVSKVCMQVFVQPLSYK